jgi:hypothetical protein
MRRAPLVDALSMPDADAILGASALGLLLVVLVLIVPLLGAT